MGLIKAAAGAIGGSLADSWLEVMQPGEMDDKTVFVKGVMARKDDKRSSNTKGTADVVSNGSIIQVYDNQFMMLVDGGKVIDYTAEPGYYKVDNSAMPSLFNGQFKDSLKNTWQRFKFGGVPPQTQKVFYVNLQEIKGIKFGTKNPINYFDSFYNAELFLRAFGNYSIRVSDPILFYQEAIPRNAEHVQIEEINDQYLSEFMTALQASINKMSADGERISFVASKSVELSKYMSETLDEDWNKMRGMMVQAVGIESVSYDDESQKLINMRNQGAMLSDPGVREGYVQGSVARGLESAGSNPNGAMGAFMGVGMGMNAGGSFMGAASNNNMQQMQQQQTQQNQQAPAGGAVAGGWTCACGAQNTGKFCAECGKPQPSAWTCACGTQNTGKFCSNCGKPMPADWTCECGTQNSGKFCSNCGKPQP